MRILLIGSGGREHALAWKISQSPRLTRLYAAPGSEAIADYAACSPLDAADHAAVIAFCLRQGISLVVIGPEAPLADGLGDSLVKAGIPVFGPGRAAARLESSKAHAKDFMRRHAIPTGESWDFDTIESARAHLAAAAFPLVVKADGLAAGKGVRICADAREALAALDDFMGERIFGDAGKRVVLEEFLRGPEASIMGLCDGKTFLELPPSSDHKRLRDDDQGPNTGGMGVIAPAPCVDEAMSRRIRTEVLDPVLKGLAVDGIEYRGVLYCGLMLTADGPKVLEFNVRFGDPETQAVLPLVDKDILPLLEAAARGSLPRNATLLPGDRAAVCVVLASEGYPEKPVTGRAISGLDATDAREGTLIFHAGTRRDGKTWKSAGGRVLGVTGIGADLEEARRLAYDRVERIRFQGVVYRRDIGRAHSPLLEKTK